MRLFIKPMCSDFIPPKQSTEGSAGYDIFMPEDGYIAYNETIKVNLGFASAIPKGHVALILPRSGVGSKYGLELNNTCGVIDSDYRGEWVATLKVKSPHESYIWKKGDRLLQFVVVPVPQLEMVITDSLDMTDRGEGGLGSTGK